MHPRTIKVESGPY